MEMTKAINKQLASGGVPFAKATIVAQLKKRMDQYKLTFSEYEVSKASGSNRFRSDLEREVYRTWQMYQEDIEASNKEREKKRQDLDKKEVLKGRLAELVIEGDKRQQKRKLKQSNNSKDADAASNSKKIAVGSSSSDPIDLECEESKMLKQYLDMRD